MNNSCAGIIRIRFIGYNLSLSGTPLSFFAKVGKKFAFALKIDKKYKVNKNKIIIDLLHDFFIFVNRFVKK